MNNRYYLLIENVCQDTQTQIAAIMAEYGNPSFRVFMSLHEYGEIGIEEYAVSKIMTYFQRTK